MLTSLWFSVDPEIKQKVDASIASNKQDISMCDNERKALNEEMNILVEEDKEFQNRHVCTLFKSPMCTICCNSPFRRTLRRAGMPFAKRQNVRQNWNLNLVRHLVTWSYDES